MKPYLSLVQWRAAVLGPQLSPAPNDDGPAYSPNIDRIIEVAAADGFSRVPVPGPCLMRSQLNAKMRAEIEGTGIEKP
ncbi:MAG: hypothetical protein L0228_10340 [Planctomycetes bacterium]|nr:hypothetical protein [Planctomycetota bacterium]